MENRLKELIEDLIAEIEQEELDIEVVDDLN